MNLPKNFKKDFLNILKGLILILVLYYTTTLFTGCPIKYVLGIACPGCGMTRAWFSILRLDFATALYYHPLFFIGPIAIFAILFHQWIDFKKWRYLGILLLVLFVGVYLLRLFLFPNAIVNLDFSEGLIFKILTQILS